LKYPDRKRMQGKEKSGRQLIFSLCGVIAE
jgi:hypothetical protein